MCGCQHNVRVPGMSMPRYRACGRPTVEGTDRCKIHTPDAIAVRETKALERQKDRDKIRQALYHNRFRRPS